VQSGDTATQYHLYRDALALWGPRFGPTGSPWSFAHRAEKRVLGRRARPYRGSGRLPQHGILPVVTDHHFTTPLGPRGGRLGRPGDRRPLHPRLRADRRGAGRPTASRARSTRPTSCRVWATSTVRSPERPLGPTRRQRALVGRAAKASTPSRRARRRGRRPCVLWRLVVRGVRETLANVRHMHEGQFARRARTATSWRAA